MYVPDDNDHDNDTIPMTIRQIRAVLDNLYRPKHPLLNETANSVFAQADRQCRDAFGIGLYDAERGAKRLGPWKALIQLSPFEWWHARYRLEGIDREREFELSKAHVCGCGCRRPSIRDCISGHTPQDPPPGPDIWRQIELRSIIDRSNAELALAGVLV